MSGDFDFEPVRGLPARLPEDEQMLWQGAPSWKDLAVHALHVRKVLFYFVALAVLQGVIQLGSGATAAQASRPFLWLIPMGIVAAAILSLIAYASARTTVYTLTSKRLVMRVGIALPVTINVPFKLVDGASVKVNPNGTGDIPLKMRDGNRLAYLLLWPHARPWFFAKPQPTLRCIRNADRVATLLAQTISTVPAAVSAVEVSHTAEPAAIAA